MRVLEASRGYLVSISESGSQDRILNRGGQAESIRDSSQDTEKDGD